MENLELSLVLLLGESENAQCGPGSFSSTVIHNDVSCCLIRVKDDRGYLERQSINSYLLSSMVILVNGILAWDKAIWGLNNSAKFALGIKGKETTL